MSTTSLNAIASSSKRAAPTSTTTNPNKRARPSSVKSESVHEDDDLSEGEGEGNPDESARAKAARKEARTIRNRESAQRSRNQRKAHLVQLEQRVLALEAENHALRIGTPPPARASSAERESSPAQSVISLANDLGIPPEIVTSSGGVNLANVAPPPADLDVKPVIASASPTSIQPLALLGDKGVVVDQLQAENAGLKERVGLLSNLVKQLFALANLDGSTASTLSVPAQTAVNPLQPIDWQSTVNAPTLSPSMFAIQPLQPAQTDLSLPTSFSTVPTFPSEAEMNLACHPAVMVTRATPSSRALQRARTTSSLVPLEMSTDRLEMVAKVVIQLAKLRGMTTCTLSTWNKATTLGTTARRTRRRRMEARLARCNKQRVQLRGIGMKR